MGPDKQLLFGMIVVRDGHLSAYQLANAYEEWRASNQNSIGEYLVDKGWITREACEQIEDLVTELCDEHKGKDQDATSVDSSSPDKSQQRGASEHDTADEQLTADLPNFNETIDHPSQKDQGKTRSSTSDVSGNTANESESGKDPTAVDDSSADVQVDQLNHVHLETVNWKPDSRSRYSLTRVHGKGGLGQVWLALDEHLNREVALKEVLARKGASSETQSRLIREAQITGQLEHPNIIPIYELGTGPEDEKPFYTMRFMRGETLTLQIRDYHKKKAMGTSTVLELRRLLSIFVSICNALAYAHARGVIHRDLKPENVMLGDFGEVIVLDWGLAKLINETEHHDMRPVSLFDQKNLTDTREGKIVGSPAYMAPEQADGRVSQMDERTDIYGLGAMLFVILTGRAPHRGDKTGETLRDTMDLLKRISTGPTPVSRDLDASISKGLSAICAKSMAKARSERYDTASALADDVQCWLADEPISIHRDPWYERLARWSRKHRAWTQAGAAALLVVTGVSVVATLIVDSARRDETRALGKARESLAAETKSLEAEKIAKAEATRRLREALDTVDKSLTGVSEVVQFFPGVQPLRLRLLEEAASDYERFARENTGDPALRAESARAYSRLGNVRKLLMQFEGALQAYEQASKVLFGLVEEQSDSPEFLLDLAKVHSQIATLHSELEKHDEASEFFKQSLGAMDELARNHPTQPHYQLARVEIRINYATLFRSTSDFDRAEKSLLLAESEIGDLIKNHDELKHQHALARTRDSLGQLLYSIGRNNDAIAKLQQAISTYQDLVIDSREHPPYLEGLAATRVNMANTLRAMGRDVSAAQSYKASLDDYNTLLRSRPGMPLYVENVALCRTNLGQIYHKLGQNLRAKQELFDPSIEGFTNLVNGSPSVPRLQEELATWQVSVGTVLSDLNENELALQAFGAAMQRFQDLRTLYPGVSRYQRRLAVTSSALGRCYYKLGEVGTARDQLLTSISDLTAVIGDSSDPFAQDAIAWCYFHLANMHFEQSQKQEAASYYDKAFALREELIAEPEHLRAAAWSLAHCADPERRDPLRAIELAKQAVENSDSNPNYWSVLGAAQYRAEKWAESIESLERARQIRSREPTFEWQDCLDLFFMAMARWHTNDKEQAVIDFERGETIRTENQPGNPERIKARTEAAQLLGIVDSNVKSE